MEQHPDSPAVDTVHPAASFEPRPESGPGAELHPAPAHDNALVPRAGPPPPAAPAEAPAVDPADYKWVPVLRKPRKDGWTPQRQVDFIAALADTGCVDQAAGAVDMTVQSCYRLRRSPGAEHFARAWDVALAHAARKLVDLAFDRAIHGTEEPVFDRDGRRVGRRMRQNDRLLMFLLRAYMPDRFRHAHRDMRAPAEALPPAPEPLSLALERLEPGPPPDPHLLMPPEELEIELEVAHFGDGELPHWYRGRGDAEPAPCQPLDEEFERLLAAAKGEGTDGAAAADDDEEDPFLA